MKYGFLPRAILLAALFLICNFANAGIKIYVDSSAIGLNNGTSWVNAYTSFQPAVAAAISGDTVFVAKGTYKPSAGITRRKTFALVNGVVYMGGFPNGGGPVSSRNFTTNRSLLSGDLGVQNDSTDNAFIVVNAVNLTMSTRLCGFTIARGNADSTNFTIWGQAGGLHLGTTGAIRIDTVTFVNNYGRYVGAVFAQGGGVIMKGCTFSTNNGGSAGAGYIMGTGTFLNCSFINNRGGNGGGLSLNVACTITNCLFQNNRVTNAGGAFYGGGGSTISNCSFQFNIANNEGGVWENNNVPGTNFYDCVFNGNRAGTGAGILSYSSGFNLYRCVFTENVVTPGYGGAVYNNGGTCTIENCVFWKNSAPLYTAPAIYNNTGGTIYLTNCTFSENFCGSSQGGAYVNNSNSNAIINNCIFWGNKVSTSFDAPANSEILHFTGTLVVNNTIWQGGTPSATIYNVDPLFANQAGGNLMLLPCSPAIDTVASAAGTVDAALQPRPFNARAGSMDYDLGAYEYQFVIPPPITSSVVSFTNTSCNGSNNGTAVISAGGGTGVFTYNWTPGNPAGDGTTSVSGLSPGTWTCTITDATGCTKTQTVSITQPVVLSVTSTQTNVSCFGGNTGTASVVVAGGTPGYSYNWTPGNPTGDGTASVTGLTQGTWTCTITDANSCVITRTVNIAQPTPLTFPTVGQTNVTCAGANNGTAYVVPSGGTSPYTYNWSPGNPTGDGTTYVTNLTPGTWSCTITDFNNCTGTVTFNIVEPPVLAATQSHTDITCFGSNNGTASVIVSGGTPAYSYNWTPGNPVGDGTSSVSGLTPGTYTCTITDANACTTAQIFSITEPTLLILNTGTRIDVTCYGGTDGGASVIASGGAGGNSFDWSPGNPIGEGTNTISSLLPGTYVCIVTNANGCTASQTMFVTQPLAILPNPSQTDVTCNGSASGSASVTPVNGVGALTYSWTPSVGNTAAITNISAGNYSVEITDANGCSSTQTFLITEPPAISPNQMQNNISCAGGGNGHMMVAPSGGTGAYTYAWSPVVNNTNVLNGSPAGLYTCTITDANNCTATATFNLTEPPALAATITQTNVSCNGGSNGDAMVMVSGGTPGYTYTWSPAGGNNAMATNLSQGSYSCLVTDLYGCTLTQTFNLTEPSALSVSAVTSDVTCNGGSNGAADVTMTGGTAPYTFDWNSGTYTTEDLSGVSAASYTLVVTDANGCTINDTVAINSPTAISITLSSTDATCYSNCNGTISSVVSGGTPSYIYSWIPSGPVTPNIMGLCAGSYSIIITDASGCTATESITITSPPSMGVTYSEPMDTACLTTTGPFALSGGSPAGGTWSGPNVSGGIFDPTNATLGNSIIVYTYTDSSGCTESATDTIYVDLCMDVVDNGSGSGFDVYPNPSSGVFTVSAEASAIISIYDAVGKQVLSIRSTSVNTEIDMSGFAQGMYTVTVQTDDSLTAKQVIISR